MAPTRNDDDKLPDPPPPGSAAEELPASSVTGQRDDATEPTTPLVLPSPSPAPRTDLAPQWGTDISHGFAPPTWVVEKQRLFNAALVMYKRGMPLEAARYLQALREVDPYNEEAVHMLDIIGQELQRREQIGYTDLQAAVVQQVEPHVMGALEAEDSADALDAEDEDAEYLQEQDWQPGSTPPGKTLRKWVIRLGIIGALPVIASAIPYPLSTTNDCTILPYKRVVVRSSISGLLQRVPVSEGQSVKQGQLVAAMDPTELQQDLERVRSEIARVDAEIEILKRGATKAERVSARRAVRAKSVAVKLQKSRCRRVRGLLDNGVVAQEVLIQCTSNLERLKAALAEQRARLLVSHKKATPQQLAQGAARRRAVLAQLAAVEQRLEATKLYAPINGTVTTPDLDQKTGMRLTPGDAVLKIIDDRKMMVEIRVDEVDIDLVQLGLPVEVRVPSLPQRAHHGKVVSIGAQLHSAGSNGGAMPVGSNATHVIVVRSEINNGSGLLRPQMSGVAVIRAGRTTLLGIAIRRVLRTVRLSWLT